MAKLRCVVHDKRVQVIDIGNGNPITVHRNNGKRNEICDSNTVTIDGEFFTPNNVLNGKWVEVSEMENA